MRFSLTIALATPALRRRDGRLRPGAPAFEVASVRLNKAGPGTRQRAVMPAGDCVTFINVPVRRLIKDGISSVQAGRPLGNQNGAYLGNRDAMGNSVRISSLPQPPAPFFGRPRTDVRRALRLAVALIVFAGVEARAQSLATIEGLVTSASGDPVEGATVRASLIRFHEGRRRAVDVGRPATTDDHGHYRIEGLAAGSYVVTASAPPDGPVQPPQRNFVRLFPSEPAMPKEVVLEAGRTIDVDLSTRPMPVARISGRMFNPSGRPMTAPLLIEPSLRSGAVAPEPMGATIFPDGRFEFANVPLGEYAVQVFRTRDNPSTEGAFAGAYVQVTGANVTGVELKTTSGSTVKGRLTFANDEPIPQGRFVITAARANLDETPFWPAELAHAAVHDDETFELYGLHGPRRLVVDQAPYGWMLRAVRVNGIDVTDMPLGFGTEKESLDDVEIVVTSGGADLSGLVVEGRGRPVTSYSLLVFPVDRASWYPSSRFFRRVTPDPQGRFQIAPMLPAEYFVAAVVPFDDLDDSWQDPDALEKLAPLATRIEAVEGAKLAITIRLLR